MSQSKGIGDSAERWQRAQPGAVGPNQVPARQPLVAASPIRCPPLLLTRPTEVQTKSGSSSTHGTVAATQEVRDLDAVRTAVRMWLGRVA